MLLQICLGNYFSQDVRFEYDFIRGLAPFLLWFGVIFIVIVRCHFYCNIRIYRNVERRTTVRYRQEIFVIKFLECVSWRQGTGGSDVYTHLQICISQNAQFDMWNIKLAPTENRLGLGYKTKGTSSPTLFR